MWKWYHPFYVCQLHHNLVNNEESALTSTLPDSLSNTWLNSKEKQGHMILLYHAAIHSIYSAHHLCRYAFKWFPNKMSDV
jgi:hypothetical protein